MDTLPSPRMELDECSTPNQNNASLNEDITPKIGMCFKALEDGEDFYKHYAKREGFTVRKYSSVCIKGTKEKNYQVYVCSKQGQPKENKHGMPDRKQRKRASVKEDCPAKFSLQRQNDGQWVVTKFEELHSHLCVTPKKRQFLSNNREVKDIHRNLMGSFQEANMRTSQLMSVFEIEHGDYSDIGCTERDIRNALQKEKDAMRFHDAQLMIEYFEDKKKLNPAFFYEYLIDDDNKLTHVFWVDGLARKAFQHFGDVLVFDTTYNTNQYSMIFAPFTGINHYGQTINFGAGFLKDETTTSFIWIFQTWHRAMCSKSPHMIITDQDPAMSTAISVVFPESNHKFCMWHILKKLSDKLSARVVQRGDFTIPFHRNIWKSITAAEFESKWKEILLKNNLQDNQWLSSIYEIREKWIPAYAKDLNVFTAGIRTTQRSESMNSFIDHFVSHKNTLFQFMGRFDRAIKKQRHNQLTAEHNDLHTLPILQTNLLVEAQLAKIYTRPMFKVFQEQLHSSLKFATAIQHMDETYHTYMVKKFGTQNVSFKVVFNIGSKFATCECKRFETQGIPCKHILVVLRNEFVDTLSPQYILNRWTISAATDTVCDEFGVELGGSYGKAQNLDMIEIANDYHFLVSMAKKSHDMCLKVRKAMSDTRKAIEAAIPSDDETSENMKRKLPENISVHPPDIAKTKGSGRRLKGGKEKAIEKPLRLCKFCLKHVRGHDIRNCPEKKKQKESEVENQAQCEPPNS